MCVVHNVRGFTKCAAQERELRLREYMRVLGMLDAAYWGSWFATHMAMLMLSGVLCAYIGQCAPRLLLCSFAV